MNKKSITDINIKGKRVLVRVDFNVPLDEDCKITDDTRIKAALPTIAHILKEGGMAILMSHLGRPKGKVVDSMKLAPVAKRLEELLGKKVLYLRDSIGPEVEAATKAMKPGEVILLENLRFHKAETDNDPDFSGKLASLGEVFVNDAFGTCHRAHASTEGVTKYLKGAAGFLVQKEIDYFQRATANPEKPYISILGGAKVSDKIAVIENLLEKIDAILIGGGMAYTFLKVLGKQIGNSLLEADKQDVARQILDKAKEANVKIALPIDHIIADKYDKSAQSKECGEDVPDGWMGLDIGPKTVKAFKDLLKDAKTIVWNGPLGVAEFDKFRNGTKEIAGYIAGLDATTIIGGGDTAAAITQLGLADKMSHISTGGGASLEYLEGKVLPGVAALEDK